ncbi:MAG: 50S ribosomal protein L11 methyltransferase [Hyphomicrobiales bacterium]|nr:50S ribosomal protein L11 methyltransferase [Hyphomicrobiales bacterium]
MSETPARAFINAVDEDPVLSGVACDAVEAARNSWRLALYFETKPKKAERAAIGALAKQVCGNKTPTIQIERLADADWVAKSLESLRPIRVGRFMVHGAHDRAAVRANDIAIEIEANQAFGTGHHGTTAGCLAAIGDLAKRQPINRALDVGTGSGVLAVAIARLFHVPVLATDIDPMAVRIAAENTRVNGVAPLVRTIHADGLSGPAFAQSGSFDLIVANILAKPLVRLAPSIRAHLAPGGAVILSGLLTRQTKRVAGAYRAQGLCLRQTNARGEWQTLIVERGGRL